MPLYTRIIKTCADELLPMTHRSPGIHLSGILRGIALSQGLFKESGGRGENTKQTYFALGNALEWAIAERYKQDWLSRNSTPRYIHGLEVELDDVFCNLDLLDVFDYAVEEVKLTKKSSWYVKTDGEFDAAKCDADKSVWLYQCQLKAQIFALGKNRANRYALGRLHVGYINGDYPERRKNNSYEGCPEDYVCIEYDYTEQELANNWQMILNHKHLAEPEGED